MLLPETKEREAQFKLALRMGFPIFLLSSVLIFSLLSQYLEFIPQSFFIIGVGVFAVAVYFSFYLIYKGYDERITDPITHMFTREYIMSFFAKEIQKGSYTFILMSINNLNDINQQYGIKNGDVVLYETAQWIGRFFEEKGIKNFPIGMLKGGDFIIGLKGAKEQYTTMIDILCMKVEDYIVKDIEVYITGAILDNTFSDDMDRIVDRLIEIKNTKTCSNNIAASELNTDPDLLEKRVVHAVQDSRYSVLFQAIEGDRNDMFESSIKLLDDFGKIIHYKNYMPVINRLRLNRELDLMQFDVIAEYLQYYKKVTLALSVSPSSVRQNLFFQRVQMALSDIELNGRLIFIISEKEYFGNIKRYNDTLQSYRRMGIKIAVDNLGSNQTSLLYMKDLDIDVVLIDNSFAKHLAEPGYKEIIEGLCSSARALRIKTWIRMIENEEMFNIAKAMKIDYIQGYHIGKFEPFENIYKEE